MNPTVDEHPDMSASGGASAAHLGADAPALRARASQAYAAQSRDAVEEKLILDHLPLVRHIVQKITCNVRSGVEFEDLVSAGTLGLVRAAKAFDPTRDAEFKTYAYIRVRGAVIDELRGRSFAPASVRQRIKAVQKAYQSLAGSRGPAEAPSDEDVAASAGLTLEEFYKVLEEARRQQFLSIHGLNEEHPVLGTLAPVDGEPGPDEQAERKETLERLAIAIQELPKRDRIVLLLYYERDLTMKEAAEVLGVTESRVSQLHASAVFKLSMKMKGEA